MESEESLGDEMPNFVFVGLFSKSYLRASMYYTAMRKPKRPPRAKIMGGEVQKMSKIREKEALSS